METSHSLPSFVLVLLLVCPYLLLGPGLESAVQACLASEPQGIHHTASGRERQPPVSGVVLT